MDYKQKYEEALSKAQQLLDDDPEVPWTDNDILYIFPELKESEDERIRKQTLKVLNYYKDEEKSEGRMPTEIEECIAWLEKQSNEPNWCHHKVDLSDCSEEYRKAYYDGWNNCNMQHSQCKSELDDVLKCLINGMKFYYEDNKDATWGTDKWSMPVKYIIEVLEKQGEQKPAWSEEDEEMLEDIKFNFEYNKEKMTDALVEQYNRFFDKIKSLQPQPKQEWSEEDERHINSLIIMLEADEELMLARDYYKTLKDWLKSLKGRMKGE